MVLNMHGDYGEGAYVKGTFALYEGDKLQILVGQEGSYDKYATVVVVVVVVLLRKAQAMETRPHLSLLVVVVAVDIIVEIM